MTRPQFLVYIKRMAKRLDETAWDYQLSPFGLVVYFKLGLSRSSDYYWIGWPEEEQDYISFQINGCPAGMDMDAVLAFEAAIDTSLFDDIAMELLLEA